MKIKLLATALLFSCVSLFSQGITFEHGTFEEALSKAKAENKMLFMDCYTSWCGPCKMLQSGPFQDPGVGEFFNENFISFKIDCEKGEGPGICSKYSVTAYPSLFFINGDGKVVQKSMGYRPAEGLINEAKRAMGGSTTVLNEYKTKYQNGERNEDVLRGLVMNLAKNGDPYDIYWKEYLATQKSENLLNDANAKLIFELTNSMNSPSFSYFIDFKNYFIEKYTKDSYERRFESIVGKTVREAVLKKDNAMFSSAMTIVKSNKMSRGQEIINKQSLFYYSNVKDMVNYDKVAMAYLKKTKIVAPNEFTEIMNNYIAQVENPSLLNKAVAACKKSIAKENKYYNNIALASLYYKLKNQADAIAIAQYALELGKKEGVNYWPAQEIINKVQIERGAKK